MISSFAKSTPDPNSGEREVDGDARPAPHPRTAARVVDGKALIVVIDQRRLHRLNAVGTRIWQLCDGRSIGAIAQVIGVEFDVEPQVALADVRAFVAELLAIGALALEDA